MAVVVKTVLGSHFGVGAPPNFEPILVVGLGCSLGVRGIGVLTHSHIALGQGGGAGSASRCVWPALTDREWGNGIQGKHVPHPPPEGFKRRPCVWSSMY